MKIAIIGAGFAGLSTAKVLRQTGHEVVVYEKAPDVGGVWSATRRYPGVSTQNNKGTYALSDHPMPKSYPEWPSGEQVQQYLASYVEKFGLASVLRLSTEVTSAELLPDESGWTVTTAAGTEQFDHLVVANGIFSEPFIPDYPGTKAFQAAGGKVLAASDFHDVAEAKGKHVAIVGYGKSSCDVAIPVSEVAASTDVIARHLLWKVPKKLGGAVNFKYLLLTRLGEALFKYIKPVGIEKFLHGPGNGVRVQLVGSVQGAITGQLRLKKLGLVPNGSFEDIARSTVSLATDGFYEKVAAKKIGVRRDTEIRALAVVGGKPVAELSDGSSIPADLVIAGTGWRQVVPFFSETVHDRLTDDRGNFRLYRQIHPIDVPHLSFGGYNSSFFSPLSAEVAAIWIAQHLAGKLKLPSKAAMLTHVDERLVWMEQRTDGKHARGTNIIPFSMHNIDEVLNELGWNVGPITRLKQWLLPVDPGSYKHIAARLTPVAATQSAKVPAAR